MSISILSQKWRQSCRLYSRFLALFASTISQVILRQIFHHRRFQCIASNSLPLVANHPSAVVHFIETIQIVQALFWLCNIEHNKIITWDEKKTHTNRTYFSQRRRNLRSQRLFVRIIIYLKWAKLPIFISQNIGWQIQFNAFYNNDKHNDLHKCK